MFAAILSSRIFLIIVYSSILVCAQDGEHHRLGLCPCSRHFVLLPSTSLDVDGLWTAEIRSATAGMQPETLMRPYRGTRCDSLVRAAHHHACRSSRNSGIGARLSKQLLFAVVFLVLCTRILTIWSGGLGRDRMTFNWNSLDLIIELARILVMRIPSLESKWLCIDEHTGVLYRC
jgi:hypothetical protein